MDTPTKKIPSLSLQALQRLPGYLQYLRMLRKNNVEMIAAAKAAAYFRFTEIQVRKDFAAISSSKGRPKAGFAVNELIDDIENYLGFCNATKAVLVGAGSLGKALLSYAGFSEYGLEIVAAFDTDAKKVGTTVQGKNVLEMSKLKSYCNRRDIHIGIITVPAPTAQIVCNQLVDAGIKAVWNFAPLHLTVPEGILVQNENMAVSLALLSKHLVDTLRQEE